MNSHKTILITGSTDGIGLAAAHRFVEQGHRVLLHGRNAGKLEQARKALAARDAGPVDVYLADFARLQDVERLAREVAADHGQLDVLVNNAGVFKALASGTPVGIDLRFVVNSIAPFLLTRELMPLLGKSGRVINLSSAAQARVNLDALAGKAGLTADMDAYAQSKLALTMWSRHLGLALKGKGPVIVAVNPGSLLGTKMVKQGFGVAGHDIGIGAEIIERAALAPEFASASGEFFDNDAGDFGAPHADALDANKLEAVVKTIDALLSAPGNSG